MSFVDKTLTCSDCNAGFTFTASEQEFFASKGFTHEPGRCPDCRTARKQQRGNGYGNGGGSYRQPREMHPASRCMRLLWQEHSGTLRAPKRAPCVLL